MGQHCLHSFASEICKQNIGFLIAWLHYQLSPNSVVCNEFPKKVKQRFGRRGRFGVTVKRRQIRSCFPQFNCTAFKINVNLKNEDGLFVSAWIMLEVPGNIFAHCLTYFMFQLCLIILIFFLPVPLIPRSLFTDAYFYWTIVTGKSL